jgi:prolyl 4-hydroxylase
MQANPQLVKWLQTEIGRGCLPDAMVQSMIKSGYEKGFARAVVDASFASAAVRKNQQPAATATAALTQTDDSVAGHNVPDQDQGSSTSSMGLDGNWVDTSDRRVEVLLTLNSPRIVLFGNVLSDQECDELIELSKPKLTRSEVVNSVGGDHVVDEARTSYGAAFQRGETPLLTKIENRIAELVGWPVENGEGLQMLRYGIGGEYRPHFDYFNKDKPGEAKQMEVGGQRIATLVLYLNNVEAGGSTVFPNVGLETMPRKGNAVYFAYAGLDGSLDARSLHGGTPIIRGEKWIATKWLRERQYG